MRGVRVGVALALGPLLAGCSGGIFPPKELPEWAMNRQHVETRTRTGRRTSDAPNQPDISFVTPMADTLPFTPEWQARENAFDQKLRRRMNICNGC
jgi:hypothetical protein